MKSVALIIMVSCSTFNYAMEVEQKEIADAKKVCWSDFIAQLPFEIQNIIFGYFPSYAVETYRNDKGYLVCKKSPDDRIKLKHSKGNEYFFEWHNQKGEKRRQRIKSKRKDFLSTCYYTQPHKGENSFCIMDREEYDMPGIRSSEHQATLRQWEHEIYAPAQKGKKENILLNVHPNEEIFISANHTNIRIFDKSQFSDIKPVKLDIPLEELKKVLKIKEAESFRVTFVDFVEFVSFYNPDEKAERIITFALRKNNEEHISYYTLSMVGNLNDIKGESLIYRGSCKAPYDATTETKKFMYDITPYYIKKVPYESLQEIALVADVSALVADHEASQKEKDNLLKKFNALTAERQHALHEVKLHGESIFKQLEKSSL